MNVQRAVPHFCFWMVHEEKSHWLTSRKREQTSVTLTSPILSILLLSSQSLPSAISCSRLHLLSLANGFLREGMIDKCAALMSTCTDDWLAWHKSKTLQWLPVIMFDWQLAGPPPFSSKCSLIMKQWQSVVKRQGFAHIKNLNQPCTNFALPLPRPDYVVKLQNSWKANITVWYAT